MVMHNQGKQAFKRVRRKLNLEVIRQPLPLYAWPGGYPIRYMSKDCEYICPACVNENIGLIDVAIKYHDNREWEVIAMDINYEDGDCRCANCHKLIEAAYV